MILRRSQVGLARLALRSRSPQPGHGTFPRRKPCQRREPPLRRRPRQTLEAAHAAKIGQQIARRHRAQKLPKRWIAQQHPQHFHPQRLQRKLPTGHLLARARLLASFRGEVQRHRLQMRPAQQAIHCVELRSKLLVIFVRANGSQGWTQPTLYGYRFADGSLICDRAQIIADVFWPKLGNPPGFGQYHFTGSSVDQPLMSSGQAPPSPTFR